MPRMRVLDAALFESPKSAPDHELDPVVADLVSERERQDLSPSEVARLCGWTRQNQYRLESGATSNPGIKTLSKFAEVLGFRLRLTRG